MARGSEMGCTGKPPPALSDRCTSEYADRGFSVCCQMVPLQLCLQPEYSTVVKRCYRPSITCLVFMPCLFVKLNFASDGRTNESRACELQLQRGSGGKEEETVVYGRLPDRGHTSWEMNGLSWNSIELRTFRFRKSLPENWLWLDESFHSPTRAGSGVSPLWIITEDQLLFLKSRFRQH